MTNDQTPDTGQQAAVERLKPCPFCGEPAERVDIEQGENAGGSCIVCTRCQASGNVEFGYKENFISNWNRRHEAEHLTTVGDDEETYEIGKRDGYESAVQDIDMRTGGDGEYFASTIPGRGCPDAPTMMQNIVDRFEALRASPASGEKEENWPQHGRGGRSGIGPDDPLYKAFRPKPVSDAAKDRKKRAKKVAKARAE